MNNPFAPQPSPAPTAPNPFAVGGAGVAAIQAAFAAQPAAPAANPPVPAPLANPFAVAQPPAPAPASVVPPQATAFAPLNPPGEAGLGGPPQAPPKMRPDDIVEQPPRIEAPTFTPPAEPAAPKRSRKPRAKADAAPTPVGTAVVGGHEVTVYTPADDEDYTVTPPDLSNVSTEELREALKSRGWTVTLTDG